MSKFAPICLDENEAEPTCAGNCSATPICLDDYAMLDVKATSHPNKLKVHIKQEQEENEAEPTCAGNCSAKLKRKVVEDGRYAGPSTPSKQASKMPVSYERRKRSSDSRDGRVETDRDAFHTECQSRGIDGRRESHDGSHRRKDGRRESDGGGEVDKSLDDVVQLPVVGSKRDAEVERNRYSKIEERLLKISLLVNGIGEPQGNCEKVVSKLLGTVVDKKLSPRMTWSSVSGEVMYQICQQVQTMFKEGSKLSQMWIHSKARKLLDAARYRAKNELWRKQFISTDEDFLQEFENSPEPV